MKTVKHAQLAIKTEEKENVWLKIDSLFPGELLIIKKICGKKYLTCVRDQFAESQKMLLQ